MRHIHFIGLLRMHIRWHCSWCFAHIAIVVLDDFFSIGLDAYRISSATPTTMLSVIPADSGHVFSIGVIMRSDG